MYLAFVAYHVNSSGAAPQPLKSLRSDVLRKLNDLASYCYGASASERDGPLQRTESSLVTGASLVKRMANTSTSS